MARSFSIRKFDRFVPLVLSLLFVAFTAPGITWGAPEFWHPDEIIQATDKAIERGKPFDEENFDYPSLPKYVHLGVARVVYMLGYTKMEFIQVARLISVLLGGAIVVLTYVLARLLGGGVLAAGIAALFILSNRDFALYFRFAHSDPYLVFFTCLCALCLLFYKLKGQRLWLYAAFLGVGLAASSKYNGASLIFAVLVVHLVTNWRMLIRGRLAFCEILFIGLILTGLGYAIGTPKSLLWMAFYFKRATPFILRHAVYNRDADSLIGLVGQWGDLWATLDGAVSILFVGALIWYGIKVVRFLAKKPTTDRHSASLLAILFLCMIAIDLPIAVSYNYKARFFLPLIPFLAALTGLLIEEGFQFFILRGYRLAKWLSAVALLGILAFSFLRVLGVGLLFLNDNRIAASEYMKTLTPGKTIEYTPYSPNFPEGLFSEKFKHPIYFNKYEDQPPPERNPELYNQGEVGIEVRQPDYFVVESFTYRRLESQKDCASMPLECKFFERLFAGETNYELLKSFEYSLPAFFPDHEASFLNPVIKIYQRKGTSALD